MSRLQGQPHASCRVTEQHDRHDGLQDHKRPSTHPKCAVGQALVKVWEKSRWERGLNCSWFPRHRPWTKHQDLAFTAAALSLSCEAPVNMLGARAGMGG